MTDRTEYQGASGTTTPDGPWLEYRKTAPVFAFQAGHPFLVHTREGDMTGEAGDYLCQGPAGERWPVKREIFEATYELAGGTI
jgi:hypothetical protein